MDKQIIKEKQIEAILGLLFILPAIIGIICFLFQLFFGDYTGSLYDLHSIWGNVENYSDSDYSFYGYAAFSPTPIFMGQ